MVKVDRIGAIFMANDIIITSCTKHVDVRHKYVNKYVEDGFIKIVFVKPAENDSSILTQNLSADLYEKF